MSDKREDKRIYRYTTSNTMFMRHMHITERKNKKKRRKNGEANQTHLYNMTTILMLKIYHCSKHNYKIYSVIPNV